MPQDRILMNPGPRFEEICALHLYQQKTGQTMEILFRDVHGDPGPSVPDIDVREPYPRHSSAFEQMALRLGCADEFADLIQIFNEDNQEGNLNRKPFRDSFVWLIPRLFELAPQQPEEKIHYRRSVIAEAGELAELAFSAYGNSQLIDYLRGLRKSRRGLLKNWPKRQQFVRHWPLLAEAYPSPLTLSGYAYVRFLRKEKVELISAGVKKWHDLFSQVRHEFDQVFERLQAQNPKLFRMKDLWVAHLKVRHNFDTKAFFSIFKSVQVVVAYDERSSVPQAVIQVRHGVDLRAMMDCLYLAITEQEPNCWHYNQRSIPGPTGTLLNGGRNRFRERSSKLAADPQKILALINQCI